MVPVYIPIYMDKWKTLTAVLSEAERNRVIAAYLDHVTFGKEPGKMSKSARGFYEFLVTSPIKNGRGAPVGNQNAARKQIQNKSENNSKNNSLELNENKSENNSKTIFTKTETNTESVVPKKPAKEVSLESTQEKEKAKAKEKSGAKLETCPKCGGSLFLSDTFSACRKCKVMYCYLPGEKIQEEPLADVSELSERWAKFRKRAD